MNYMDELFEAWFPHSKDTPEALAIMQKMSDNNDENYDALIRCICAVSRQGFEAGFDCAVQLLKMENEKKFKNFKDPNEDETDFSNEEWRKVDGYENYSVSNYGRVRNDIKMKLLKLKTNPSGYSAVCLCKDGKVWTTTVHRLVATAFLPLDEKKVIVNHIDGNRKNNRVNNLEWCTYTENSNHTIRTESTPLQIPILVYKNNKLYKTYHSKTSLYYELHISPRTINKYLDTGKTYNGYEFRLTK